MKVIDHPAAKKEQSKPKKAELFYRMVRHINGHEAGLRTAFTREFLLVEHAKGVFTPVEVTSPSLQTVEYCSRDEIQRAVAAWVWEYGPTDAWHWSADEIKKCVDLWFIITPPVEMPAAVKFASQTGYCFLKHPFDPDNLRPTPTYDEILSRMSNADAFLAFVGSLFIKEAKQQQYLWLKGAGQDSKGCITRVIKKLLGPACRSANPPSKGQNPGFWLDNIMKAKCVVFNDINDRAFITTGLGKSLTGGDVQSCEKKYGASYDAIFEGKLIFTSNWTPDISSEHSDQRRIIYCELDEKADKTIDPAYEARLLLEAQCFLYKCLETYRRLCPKHEPIPVDNSKALEIAQENEEDYELLMDRFQFFPIDASVPLAKNKKMPETELTNEIRHFFRGQPRKARDGFKKWLKRKYGNKIHIGPIKEGGVTKRYVVGLIKREAVFCN